MNRSTPNNWRVRTMSKWSCVLVLGFLFASDWVYQTRVEEERDLCSKRVWIQFCGEESKECDGPGRRVKAFVEIDLDCRQNRCPFVHEIDSCRELVFGHLCLTDIRDGGLCGKADYREWVRLTADRACH